jgi:hypothetical protein
MSQQGKPCAASAVWRDNWTRGTFNSRHIAPAGQFARTTEPGHLDAVIPSLVLQRHLGERVIRIAGNGWSWPGTCVGASRPTRTRRDRNPGRSLGPPG